MSDDIDKHTFLYTSNGVYESSLKLYELEAKLADRDFIRASKNSLFNISHIQAIEPDFYFGAFYYCP
jgi:two-component system, LytTR family, response regulator LytT